ncbi:response regulator [Roseovarius sp. S1116L3]|uniref:response regulator n=1 Tax=Roseovarius roseus TaxID=3342636 RepID=UPI003727E4AF
MKILAVDDDPIILELLTEVLRAAGFTNLSVCSSASKALDLLDHTDVPFDCFLLDIQMPEMDGIQLTSAIRKRPPYTKTPILMITAMSDRTYIDGAFAAGASDYITKPFEIGEVHARLRLIEELVVKRKQQEDRNPVSVPRASTSMVGPEDLAKRLTPVDVDGVIDYVALENYLLQVSRVSLFGMQAFGIVVPDMGRTFLSSSLYEYESTVSDLAEAISESLKPRDFFVAHAGAGEFIVVLKEGGALDPAEYEIHLRSTLNAMDLHFCDGRPVSLRPVVGHARSLQMKPSRGITNTLVHALSDAEKTAERPRDDLSSNTSSWKRLLGW